jgi:hypothetical protein
MFVCYPFALMTVTVNALADNDVQYIGMYLYINLILPVQIVTIR